MRLYAKLVMDQVDSGSVCNHTSDEHLRAEKETRHR